jgi:hypothetical protein
VSIDRHRDFIRANAALKLATELDAAGLRYGALLAWLKAVRVLGEIEAGVPAAADRPAIESALAEAHATLAGSSRDESIALVLVEAAQGAIAASTDAASTGEALRAGRAVLDRALPAYRAALDPPAARTAAATAPAVRVTLVRWPYT